MTCMRELPILFSPPMVRAILEGRKTQTRRVVKGIRNDNCLSLRRASAKKAGVITHVMDAPEHGLCPYGQPGDRLWVKERWRPVVAHSCYENACDCSDVNVQYAADGEIRYFADCDIPTEWTLPKAAARGDVTPLFMPRWASRITLEVTGVRVERLQDISEADAIAEGIERASGIFSCAPWRNYQGDRLFSAPTASFRSLWDSLNGPPEPKHIRQRRKKEKPVDRPIKLYPNRWNANPWVWVVEFKRIEVARG